jgi:hypothetical protein
MERSQDIQKVKGEVTTPAANVAEAAEGMETQAPMDTKASLTTVPPKEEYTGPANKPDQNLILQGGDDCANATAIGGIPYTADGTTSGYTDDYDEVCPYTGSTSPDVVYSYTPEADIWVDINLCVGQTDYDTKLYIYEDECQVPDDGQDPYECNDDDCVAPSGQSYVSALYCVPLFAGHTYYIVIDGYGGDFGPYTMEITECQPPTGACCVGSECVATNTQPECDALGGNWYEGETCPEFQCPLPLPCWDGVNILWDNGDTDGSNGYSIYYDLGRWLLDDFVVPEGGMTISDFHQTYIWNSFPPGTGTDYELNLYADDGGMTGAFLMALNTTLVSEVPTGRAFFGRNEAVGNVAIEPVFLDAGTYWLEMTVVGPENCFAMIHAYLTGSECWWRADDLGFFGPGSDNFGTAADVNFCLTGDPPPTGACCDMETYECNDDVLFSDCPAPLRFEANTLCADLDPPCAAPTGACCVDEECVATNTVDECDALGGVWYEGETCPEFMCPFTPEPGCPIQQPPNAENGLFSDYDCDFCGQGMQFMADDIIVPSATDLTYLTFWGGYFPDDINFDPDEFLVLVYEDAGGVPGAPVYDLGVIPADAKALTGNVLFGVSEWVYEIDLTPYGITVGPGTFWIGIHNNTHDNTDSWFWETGDQDPYNGGGPGNAVFNTTDPYTGSWGATGYDMSFVVECEGGPVPEGACCDNVTGDCVDNVPFDQCPDGFRFEEGVLCADLDPPCGECPDAQIVIEIFTDNYPSETTWDLYNADGTFIGSGGPYSSPGTLYQHVFCVDAGCYIFTIYDAFGDGICCDYGDGYYNVYYNGTLECTGGEFGSSESCTFGSCVGACCVDLDCVATNTQEECDALGGDWYFGQDCDAGFECPLPPLDCGEAVYDNGPDDFLNVYAAQCDPVYPFIVEVADDFVLPADANITHISAAIGFWSTNPCGIDGLLGMTAVIYNDGGGIPGGTPGVGDCTHDGDVVWEQTYAPGEYTLSDLGGPDGNTQVDMATGGVALTGGVTYWLGIMVHIDLSACGQGGWTPTALQVGSVPLLWSDYFGIYWTDPFGYGYDMAFCLHEIGGGGQCGDYVIGDYNCSGGANVADVVEMYSKLKTGAPTYPDCECDCEGDGNIWPVGGDVNNSCAMNVADVVDLYSKLKTGSPELEACELCPPSGLVPPGGGEDRPLVVPNLESKARLKTGSGMD